MVKKIIFWGIGIVLVLVVVLGIFAFIQLQQMKPSYTDVAIPSMNKPVTVEWDSNGVVHIQGESIRDVVIAAGYTAAKERLWQMEMVRRLAQGRLSEVFGDTTVKIDRLFLTLGIDSLTRVLYQSISEQSRQWLQWYARGINSYLEQAGDDLPLEFVLMRLHPKPWTPEECLYQTRMMAWFLNFNWKADALYWLMYSKLPPEKFREIWPDWNHYPTILKASEVNRLAAELNELDRGIQALFSPSGFVPGSNNWVLAPSRTTTGAAILANDPHLHLDIPPIWMEMHLQAPGLNVAGFAFPATPGIIIGRNEQIAWGVTNGMIDDADYFIEDIDTVKRIYRVDGKEFPLKVYRRNLPVRGEPDRWITVYETEHGPIMNSVFSRLHLNRPLALKWMGREKSDEPLTFIQLATARNWDDFNRALSHFVVPCQNFVYADIHGNIGYRLGGKVPIRSYRVGLLPTRGDASRNQWESFIPFGEMPHLYNPERGWIVTANNKITVSDKYYYSELWEPPYRALRIEKLIQQKPRLSVQDVRAMQTDVLNEMAAELLPDWLSVLKSENELTDLESDALLLLEQWDYRMERKAIAPSLYEAFQYKLIENIFKDELGDSLFSLFTNLPNFYYRIFARVVQNPASPWFDDVTTDKRETRREIILKSFRDGLNMLKEIAGRKPEYWTWAQIHTLELKHVLGQVALTRKIYNRGPYPVPGSGSTVNVATYLYREPFQMVAGPSMRFIMDWSQPTRYLSILPGGNSGNFLSDFYDNQIGDWIEGSMKTVYFRKNDTRQKMKLYPE